MENNGDLNIPKLDQLLTTEEIHKSNNISKITDKIYLGDEEGATQFDFLKEENIHNIISIVPNPPQYPEDMKMNVMHLNIEDSLAINIIKYIKNSIDFIDKADKIYIHCNCGINRGPAIAIGYLIWKTHTSYNEVFDYVKKRRDCIELNTLFIIQLDKFHNLLEKNNYNLQKVEIKSKAK